MIGHDYLLVVVPIPILSLLHVSLLPYFFYFFVLVLVFLYLFLLRFLSFLLLLLVFFYPFVFFVLALVLCTFWSLFPSNTPLHSLVCRLQLLHPFVFVFHSSITATKKQPLCPLSPAPLAAIFLFQPSSHSSNCTLRYKGT
ncbi:hypothetical protein BKA57DRAFT_122513 [Linnemannia elongata]|nr:hypothetical protein BKA57DRAFT_122513 [Linnemannia elongata]